MRITQKSEYHLDFGSDLNLSIDIMTKFMPYFLIGFKYEKGKNKNAQNI